MQRERERYTDIRTSHRWRAVNVPYQDELRKGLQRYDMRIIYLRERMKRVQILKIVFQILPRHIPPWHQPFPALLLLLTLQQPESLLYTPPVSFYSCSPNPCIQYIREREDSERNIGRKEYDNESLRARSVEDMMVQNHEIAVALPAATADTSSRVGSTVQPQ